MLLCGFEFIVGGFVLLGVECDDDHGQYAIGVDGENLVCLSKADVDKATVTRFESCKSDAPPRLFPPKDRAA